MIGPAEVEILANDGFEEMAPLHRPVEDLRETDFDLIQCETMSVASGAIGGRQWPGQPLRPAIEEGLDVAGAQRITGRLQGGGIGTREKAVVETLETNAVPPELLFHPLMAVETNLDRIRQIGADLDERRAPLAIVDVEVVLRGGDPLAREVEGDAALRAPTLLRFERPLLLLGEAEQHDPARLVKRERWAVGDRVFILAGLEFHHRNRMRGRKLLDRRGESVVHRLEERRRRNRMTEMIAQEVTEATRGLQLGHIGMQIEPVEAADFERDVLTDNGGDVGCHRNLLAEIPAMVLLKKDAGLITGPNIFSEASPQTAWHHVFTPTTVGLRRSFTE